MYWGYHRDSTLPYEPRFKGKVPPVPLSLSNSDLGRPELLVKVHEAGAMTKHLESMKQTYTKHVGMMAGGTGITPMHQLIRAICADESDKTEISVVSANNNEQDILLRDELDNFVQQCPDKFQTHYVLARPPAGWTGSSGFITEDVIKNHLPAASGPSQMINATKKSLTNLGFKEPGTFSKVTDQVFLF